MDGICHEWCAEVTRRYALTDLRTIEVGAYDVNGTVADLFTDRIGVDMRGGPGVDRVANGECLPYQDGEFQVAVSTETLEHVRRPWSFVAEMSRVVAPGGWVIVTTCDYDFPRHDFPADYWRFSPEGLALLLEDQGLTVVERKAIDGSRLFMAARKV